MAANLTPCAEDPAVVDPDPREREGLAAGLRNVAEVMAEIGWTTRLNELTEAQALRCRGRDRAASSKHARPPVREVPF